MSSWCLFLWAVVSIPSSVQNPCRLPGSSAVHCRALICLRAEGARSASWPQGIPQLHQGPPCEEPVWVCKLAVWQRSWASPFPAVLTVSELIPTPCGLHMSLCWQWEELYEPGLPVMGVSRYNNCYMVVSFSSQGSSTSQIFSEALRYISKHLKCPRLLHHCYFL